MPTIKADGCPIHVEVEGPQQAPVLMLSNSLGTTLHMWDGQVAPFTKHFRLVRYDRRGHGQSGVPQGPYTMEGLGRDVLAILDALGIEKINWCGPLHGRDGGSVVGRECAVAGQAARAHQYVELFRRQDGLERAAARL